MAVSSGEMYYNPGTPEGRIGDVPVTPEYTDLCIYCNLLCERVGRLKYAHRGKDRVAVTSSMDAAGGEGSPAYVSFFRGVSEGNGQRYLSTDYTDIHFHEVSKDGREFYEGLQISGITVKYEKFQCPTVVVSMVDVRGAGLFSKEQAVHDSGNGIESFYNAFMTVPYPKFKLTLKGYYGRPVTYNLVCSNFSGNFDSNTGNFNITASFIGYEYGCLQDVPLTYIMAAPYTKAGKAYWNKRKGSDDWNLFESKEKGYEQPITLYDFFYKVKAAKDRGSGADSIVDGSVSESLAKAGSVSAQISASKEFVDRKYEAFVKAVGAANEGSAISYESEDGGRYIVSVGGGGPVVVTSEAAALWSDIYGRIAGDGSQFGGYPFGDLPGFGKIAAGRYELADALSWDDTGVCYWVHGAAEGGMKSPFNALGGASLGMPGIGGDDVSVPGDVVKKVIDRVLSDESRPSRVWVVGFEVYADIRRAQKEADDAKKQIEAKANGGKLTPIRDVVSITPYVHNFYKLLACHLETFVYTLWSAADGIMAEMNDGVRTKGMLGIGRPSESDVPEKESVVPPFPGIFKKKTVYGNMSGEDDSLGWVGDKHGRTPWVEESLVNEYYNAARFIDAMSYQYDFCGYDSYKPEFALVPALVPSVVVGGGTRLFCDREGMAYYAGIMMAYLCGAVGCSGCYGELGALAAKYLYDATENRDWLKDIVMEKDFSGSLMNVMLCSDGGRRQVKPFEVQFVGQGNRQPLYEVNGDVLRYVYMPGNGKGAVVPLDRMESFDDLNRWYECSVGHFKPRRAVDGSYAFCGNVAEVFGYDVPNEDEYMNSYMFDVFIDTCGVADLEEEYGSFDEGALADIGVQPSAAKRIRKEHWIMSDGFEGYQRVSAKKLSEAAMGYSADNVADMANKLDKLEQ